MDKIVYILSAIIAVMLVCILFLGEKVMSKNDITEALEGLEGLWVGHDKFCADADIDGMLLYLGKFSDNCVTAVLIMHAEEVTLAFKKFDIQFKTGMLGKVDVEGSSKKLKMEAMLDELDSDDSQEPLTTIMPEKVQILYKPYKNTLQIYEYIDGKKNIYADLVKDNISAISS